MCSIFSKINKNVVCCMYLEGCTSAIRCNKGLTAIQLSANHINSKRKPEFKQASQKPAPRALL